MELYNQTEKILTRQEPQVILGQALTVAPEKGKANKAVIKVLSRLLDVKNSDIEILSGETSRDKKVLIRNISEDDFDRVI